MIHADKSTNGNTISSWSSAICVQNTLHNYKMHEADQQFFRFCTKCGKVSRLYEDENGGHKWISIPEEAWIPIAEPQEEAS